MSATLFAASELVTRNNVNSRITDINTDITNLTPVSLYNNTSGTQSTVQLSSSAANYTYMEIYYRNDDGKTSYVKVTNPDGKSVGISMLAYWDMVMYMRTTVINISGSSITWDGNATGWGTTGSGGTVIYTGNLIYITKVIGYK